MTTSIEDKDLSYEAMRERYEQLDEHNKRLFVRLVRVVHEAEQTGDELTSRLFIRTSHMNIEKRVRVLEARIWDRADTFHTTRGRARFEAPFTDVTVRYSVDGPNFVRLWYSGGSESLVACGAVEPHMVECAQSKKLRIDSFGDYFSRDKQRSGRLTIYRRITNGERAMRLPGVPKDAIRPPMPRLDLTHRRGRLGLAWSNPSHRQLPSE